MTDHNITVTTENGMKWRVSNPDSPIVEHFIKNGVPKVEPRPYRRAYLHTSMQAVDGGVRISSPITEDERKDYSEADTAKTLERWAFDRRRRAYAEQGATEVRYAYGV